MLYLGRPGVEGFVDEVPVRTSSQGWREQEFAIPKPPGTFRIVGIGDSVMFGWLEVSSARSFALHYARQGFSWRPPRLGWGQVMSGGKPKERRPWCDPTLVPERSAHLAGEENLRRALRELADLSRETQVPAAILFDGRRGEPNPFATTVPDGILILDLHEHFSRYLEAEGLASYRHPRLRVGGESGKDHHPTAEAHRVIANGLFDALVQNGLVPEPLQ